MTPAGTGGIPVQGSAGFAVTGRVSLKKNTQIFAQGLVHPDSKGDPGGVKVWGFGRFFWVVARGAPLHPQGGPVSQRGEVLGLVQPPGGS